jgi:hypothetical protein
MVTMHDLLDAQWVYDNTKDGNDNLCDLLNEFWSRFILA